MNHGRRQRRSLSANVTNRILFLTRSVAVPKTDSPKLLHIGLRRRFHRNRPFTRPNIPEGGARQFGVWPESLKQPWSAPAPHSGGMCARLTAFGKRSVNSPGGLPAHRKPPRRLLAALRADFVLQLVQNYFSICVIVHVAVLSCNAPNATVRAARRVCPARGEQIRFTSTRH